MYASSQTSQSLNNRKVLVCIDVDGTLCRIDSFTRFIFNSLPRRHIIWRGLPVLPWILAYYLKLYPAHFMRPRLFHAMFYGTNVNTMKAKALAHAKWMLTQLNPRVSEALKQHQQNGHTIVLVSAGIDIYLKHFAQLLDIQLISTQAEIDKREMTGRYITADCSGEEKVNRIQDIYNLADFECIYAYGNSEEDLPMLKMADVAYWVDHKHKILLKNFS